MEARWGLNLLTQDSSWLTTAMAETLEFIGACQHHLGGHEAIEPAAATSDGFPEFSVRLGGQTAFNGVGSSC